MILYNFIDNLQLLFVLWCFSSLVHPSIQVPIGSWFNQCPNLQLKVSKLIPKKCNSILLITQHTLNDTRQKLYQNSIQSKDFLIILLHSSNRSILISCSWKETRILIEKGRLSTKFFSNRNHIWREKA